MHPCIDDYLSPEKYVKDRACVWEVAAKGVGETFTCPP